MPRRFLTAAIALAAATLGAHAQTLFIADVDYSFSPTLSFGEQGDPRNNRLVIDLNSIAGARRGAPVLITDLGFDVSISATAPSYIADIAFGFDADGDGTPELSISPGVSDTFPGANDFSTGGLVNLNAFSLDDLMVTNGLLTVEIFERFDDAAIDPDGEISGTLSFRGTFTIPAPGAGIGLGVAALLAARRRRSAKEH